MKKIVLKKIVLMISIILSVGQFFLSQARPLDPYRPEVEKMVDEIRNLNFTDKQGFSYKMEQYATEITMSIGEIKKYANEILSRNQNIPIETKEILLNIKEQRSLREIKRYLNMIYDNDPDGFANKMRSHLNEINSKLKEIAKLAKELIQIYSNNTNFVQKLQNIYTYSQNLQSDVVYTNPLMTNEN